MDGLYLPYNRPNKNRPRENHQRFLSFSVMAHLIGTHTCVFCDILSINTVCLKGHFCPLTERIDLKFYK